MRGNEVDEVMELWTWDHYLRVILAKAAHAALAPSGILLRAASVLTDSGQVPWVIVVVLYSILTSVCTSDSVVNLKM